MSVSSVPSASSPSISEMNNNAPLGTTATTITSVVTVALNTAAIATTATSVVAASSTPPSSATLIASFFGKNLKPFFSPEDLMAYFKKIWNQEKAKGTQITYTIVATLDPFQPGLISRTPLGKWDPTKKTLSEIVEWQEITAISCKGIVLRIQTEENVYNGNFKPENVMLFFAKNTLESKSSK